MKKAKRTVFCGVTDADNNPVKLSEEDEKKFIESMSNGGEFDVVYCGDNAIPKTMELIAAIKGK